jgi:hypothetical protein
VLRWIEEQVAKRAAAADADATSKLMTTATTAGEAAKTGRAEPPKKMDIGVLAAISVAIGGIATVLGGLMQAFFGLGYLMPIGFAGLMLLISGPSMLIAWLKLRQRNLGPLLDANGWAINALTKVNLPLGRSLTEVAHIPPGSARSLTDPYAPKKSPWPRIVLVLLLLAGAAYAPYRTNLLHKWLPDWIPAHHVETSLAGPTTGAAGDQIEILVQSTAKELSVFDDASIAVRLLPVTGGKAVVAIPPGTKTGTRFTVTDPSAPANTLVIEVIEKQ